MSQVPVYVYFLFIALMYSGYKRCFPRIIKLKRLVIFPLLFIFLSLRSMVDLFHPEIDSLLFWGLGTVLGAGLGYLHIRRKSIIADHQKKLVLVPGDWSMLLLIFSFFAFEFFIHYANGANWSITKLSSYEAISIIILGLIAGMTIGRNLTYGYKYTMAPHQTLVLPD